MNGKWSFNPAFAVKRPCLANNDLDHVQQQRINKHSNCRFSTGTRMGGEGKPTGSFNLKALWSTIDENDQAIITFDMADCFPSQIHKQPLFDLSGGNASKDYPGNSIHTDTGDKLNTFAALVVCLPLALLLYSQSIHMEHYYIIIGEGQANLLLLMTGFLKVAIMMGVLPLLLAFHGFVNEALHEAQQLSFMVFLMIWQSWAHSKSSLHFFWTWVTFKFWRLLFMRRLTLVKSVSWFATPIISLGCHTSPAPGPSHLSLETAEATFVCFRIGHPKFINFFLLSCELHSKQNFRNTHSFRLLKLACSFCAGVLVASTQPIPKCTNALPGYYH